MAQSLKQLCHASTIGTTRARATRGAGSVSLLYLAPNSSKHSVMNPRSNDIAAIERALERRARTASTRRLARNILRTQNELRKLVSKRAWRAYLRVEEASGQRELAYADAIIRIAFRVAWRRTRDTTVRYVGEWALRHLLRDVDSAKGARRRRRTRRS